MKSKLVLTSLLLCLSVVFPSDAREWTGRQDRNSHHHAGDYRGKSELFHYPVNGLVQAGQTDHLIEAITSCVAPASWDQVGGAGSIRMGIRGTLDVRQSFAVHQQVAQLLADLRETRKP
jgi:hypothetical protein